MIVECCQKLRKRRIVQLLQTFNIHLVNYENYLEFELEHSRLQNKHKLQSFIRVKTTNFLGFRIHTRHTDTKFSQDFDTK